MANGNYDPAKAVFWSHFVNLAYATFDADHPNPKPPKFPDGWEFVGNLQVFLKFLDTTYFIGWIASGNGGEETAIVFLGTEDLEWLYDAEATHSDHPIGGHVESGMYDMYKSLKIATPEESETTPFAHFIESLDVSQPIHVTGHSLGGALTTFTAAAIASLPTPPESELLHVYSIASPRVGNSEFANAFNNLVPNNFRIYNVRDYVPTVPPEFLGYQHVQSPQPIPALDSWKYPVYHGWDPVKSVACYHSHAVYHYMLQKRHGQSPDPSEMGSCYVASELPKKFGIVGKVSNDS